MSTVPNLEQVQQWMLSVISDPRGVEAGIRSEAAQRQIPLSPDDIEHVVHRSTACSSEERLAVYSHAYFARLLECLQAEYSVLAQATGEEEFLSLATGYLLTHPPCSYTLCQLGARLPSYLAETRPSRDCDATVPDWADFLVDLARLERTYADVFDGPGDEQQPNLDPSELALLTVADGDVIRVQVSRSLQLLSLRFPAHETYSSLRAGALFNPPQSRPTQLAVYRRDFVVQRREITPPEATLLMSLQGDASLARALDALLDNHELFPDDAIPLLHNWFEDWTAAGIVRGLANSRHDKSPQYRQ
ncbi:MAG: putative DNA-binding domain-containing protein [Planctomycetaceae bacterium]